MTAAEFRRIALSMPQASESAHMNHPDFRVGGKIFATLGYPDQDHGMVILPPEEQERLVRVQPKTFAPAKGAWGRSGSTSVRLDAVDEPDIAERHGNGVARKSAEESSVARDQRSRLQR
jgi:hypothetical protein